MSKACPVVRIFWLKVGGIRHQFLCALIVFNCSRIFSSKIKHLRLMRILTQQAVEEPRSASRISRGVGNDILHVAGHHVKFLIEHNVFTQYCLAALLVVGSRVASLQIEVGKCKLHPAIIRIKGFCTLVADKSRVRHLYSLQGVAANDKIFRAAGILTHESSTFADKSGCVSFHKHQGEFP